MGRTETDGAAEPNKNRQSHETSFTRNGETAPFPHCKQPAFLLLLVVDAHEHANKFARNLLVMFIESLQISN